MIQRWNTRALSVAKKHAIFSSRVGQHRSFSTKKQAFDWSTLQEKLPGVKFDTNTYELERHGRGESFHPSRPPDVVLYPNCVEEVSAIVSHCYEAGIPVIPFGAGTSVEGHTCALHGGISIDMAQFQDIQIPDLTSDSFPDPIAKVGAGVTRNTLNNSLRHTGLQFVVDPGADATIGGMVACGASGTTAVKYGTMRENILEIECVLPDKNGTVVRAGTKAVKNSAGYDLLSLMCGSEGTLGVITSITVKLHPIPHQTVAAVCVFDTLMDAAQAVAALKMHEIPLSRCELLDSLSVKAFNQYQPNEPAREVKPTLFLEFQGASESMLQEQVAMSSSICLESFGGSSFEFKSSEDERKALWAARHNLYYASIALRPGAKDALLTDACVPLSYLAEVLEATARDVEDLGVVGPCFGHAGDGNFHCILPISANDSESYIDRVHQVNKNLVERTIRVGGTCTGEHGVGYGKVKYLEGQYGAGSVALMKAIKQAIDPRNIMNPGKVVDI